MLMQTITEITTNITFLTIFYNICAYLCFNQTIIKHTNFKHQDIKKLCTYIYSSLHSYIIIIGSFLFIYKKINLNTYFHFTTFTASYSLFDIIILLLNNNLNKEFLIHHTILFIGTTVRYPNKELYNYLAYGLLGEISSIFLNKTWFYLHTQPQNKKEIKINTIATVVFYTVFRIINYLYILKAAIINRFYIGISITLIVYILNLYWYVLLIKKAIYINTKNN